MFYEEKIFGFPIDRSCLGYAIDWLSYGLKIIEETFSSSGESISDSISTK